MNFLLSALSAFAFILGHDASGQNANPAVASPIRFNQYPVDLSTGLQQVSIPIYTMPTRSKDININVSLNYHPASVGVYGTRSSNAGSGWNLSTGAGVISRPDDGALEFNFFGFSGKFGFIVRPNGVIDVRVFENEGGKLAINIEYDAATNKVLAYNFHDEKGYRYRFSAKDTVHYVHHYVKDNIYDIYEVKARESAHQLTEIYDNNNNILASYTYETYDRAKTYLGAVKHDYFNTLKDITIPGFGKIEYGSYHIDEEDGLWTKFSGVMVKNFLGTVVKTFGLQQDKVYNANKLSDIILDSTIENVAASDPLVHKFYYRPIQPITTLTNTVEAVDEWGYYSSKSKFCDLVFVDPVRVEGGVLEKIKYPSGGCVIYDYESNTYSYFGGIKSEIYNFVNGVYYEDPIFYDNLTYYPHSWHNFQFLDIASLNVEFQLPESTEVYFQFNGTEECTMDFGQLVCKDPSFQLKNANNPNPASQPVIADFSVLDSGQNLCLGKKLTLPAGKYVIRTGIFGLNNSARAYIVKPKTIKNKWVLGGGIRIKSIAYFDNDVPQNFFDLWPTNRPMPRKQTNYSYNFFNEPTRSSGAAAAADGNGVIGKIRYQNITVTDATGTEGKIEYTFYNNIDFPQHFYGAIVKDFRIGKIKALKVYDSNNVLLKETAYTYSSEFTNPGNDPAEDKTGFMVPIEILNKDYFSGGAVQNKDVFSYNADRKVKEKTSFTSRSAEPLITKYYYHNFDSHNSVYSRNRVGELDYVEEFLGSDLLSKTKFEYSNLWNGNVAWLPSQIKTSKGNGALEIKIKNNLYDQYGHVLETEQENGIKKSYIWGYNNSLVVAEIDNMAYNDIPAAAITNVQNMSSGGNPNMLFSALIQLRNSPQLSDAFITTYTYIPLVGVSTVTDPRGARITYEYDDMNRLKTVRGQDGNIIEQNVYNTQPQN